MPERCRLERLQARVELLYNDRLDGRISASTYDQKASEIRQQQERFAPPACRSARAAGREPGVDLIALTAKAADLFPKPPAAEQRKLLRLILEGATWKGGELRMSFREPFFQLRLSSRAWHKIRPLKACGQRF